MDHRRAVLFEMASFLGSSFLLSLALFCIKSDEGCLVLRLRNAPFRHHASQRRLRSPRNVQIPYFDVFQVRRSWKRSDNGPQVLARSNYFFHIFTIHFLYCYFAEPRACIPYFTVMRRFTKFTTLEFLACSAASFTRCSSRYTGGPRRSETEKTRIL